jgi:hypothetical protein
VHPLVEVRLLRVDMPIEVNDADISGNVLGDASDGRVSDGVVAS